MAKEVIDHIRKNMKVPEKAKLTSQILKGYTGDGWAIEVLKIVHGEYQHGRLQSMKGLVFDILAAKYEGEE